MDKKTLEEKYPGYVTRREVTITHLVSLQGPPVYVVEDKGKNEVSDEMELTRKEFPYTTIDEVVKAYFLTSSE